MYGGDGNNGCDVNSFHYRKIRCGKIVECCHMTKEYLIGVDVIALGVHIYKYKEINNNKIIKAES